MNETRGLTAQVIDQLVEQTRDHQPTLANLASRIEPAAGELIEAWQATNRDARASDTTLPDLSEQVVRAWLAAWRQRNLRQYFSDLAAWARELASAGFPYDRALKLFQEYQRRAIPLLMRVYPAGSELETALGALDDLFDAGIGLIGAAYVEALQERAVAGSRVQALGQLFAGATHALNNRLAVVLGRLTILTEETRVAEERAELLDIQEVAAEGAQMVRRLQEFIRGDRVDAPVVAKVNPLLHDAAEITRFLWRDQAETAGVVIDVVDDFADVPPVWVRPAVLREAFVMMILNAVGALPNGGLITLRTERQGNAVLASVLSSRQVGQAHRMNQAAPFAPQSQPMIGVVPSAIAKLAAELNGTLVMETIPERGTTFTLSLPLAQKINAAEGKTQMPSHPADVLLIDNEPGVRDAFTRLLALYGHRATTAESGEQGIAAFKNGKFDVVFTDLGMPGMSGWDVAREIKKLDAKALVVLITGWPIDVNPQKLRETGVDRIVTKPIDMPTVLGLIDDAVALRGNK